MPSSYTYSLKRRQALLAMAGALCTQNALAQASGSGPWRIIVPYNAGGGIDIVAREIAQPLGERLGQPVVVENRPGAGGMLAVDAAIKATDGRSLVLGITAPMLTNVFLYSKMPYDPRRDLALVSQVADAPLALAVNPKLPVHNVAELMSFLKANKGSLAYGSWGIGTYPHLAGFYMSERTGAGMVHAAYKGEAPMLQELIGGGIHMAFASALSLKPMAEAGRLRIIGVTGARRMETLPGVPTFAEQGEVDSVYSVVGFIGFGMTARTTPEAIRQISEHIQIVCAQPQVRKRITDAGFSMKTGSPQQFQARYDADFPIYQQLVKQSGATLD
ncbi:Bug family tripartite tricarboxylate transporter substrate binding protein [Comamonas composti]|uniref:Bug family tripartite tricarboxylate transporter substrate binding protein n=1 Tax=Comamonas composti TaxID=408558 RepID=UPI0004275101|nr:tripartite tricarboxylate transporter substrate binding protein [Comamonas composti]